MFSFGVTIISLAFLVLEKNELEIGGGPILPPAPPLIRESYMDFYQLKLICTHQAHQNLQITSFYFNKIIFLVSLECMVGVINW